MPSAEMLARFGAKRPESGKTGGVATVWRQDGTRLEAVRVRTGISDNTHTEVGDGPLQEGAAVVRPIKSIGTQHAAQSTRTSNPLLSSGGLPGPR